MRLALAQMNTVVGDLDGNAQRITDTLLEARASGADLVLFPELAVTGYPPADLLLRPAFIRAARRSSTPTSTTPATSSPTARSAASIASATCRTTASSTRTATSPPAATCSC